MPHSTGDFDGQLQAHKGPELLKTIIHIGQHKTATTSIQHYLQNHRRDLAAAGLYVPDSLLGYDNPSHFLLNVYALDEHRESTAKIRLKDTVDPGYFGTLEQRLQKEIAGHYRNAARLGCREIIWTNEGLYLLNSEHEYEKLKQLFAQHSSSVLCICCFREKEDFRQSYQRQLESMGLPLSDNPDSYRYLQEDSWLLDHDRKKALLDAVFDEVLTLSYDRGDMVKVFMENLGYPASGETASLRLNSISPA